MSPQKFTAQRLNAAPLLVRTVVTVDGVTESVQETYRASEGLVRIECDPRTAKLIMSLTGKVGGNGDARERISRVYEGLKDALFDGEFRAYFASPELREVEGHMFTAILS